MTESRERTVIATTTLLSSLAFYQYAKSKGKSEVPYVMMGAFVGAVVAELALLQMSKQKKL
jgi:multisubunit Na+/H+ antiporter MnhB subunit